MNDTERREWVGNDEFLYREARRYRGGITKYIRDNREEIDAMINAVLNNERQPHTGPTGHYLY